MKKTMTVEVAVKAYNALKDAKVTKMEAAEKIAVVKAVRALKAEATALADFEETAREKLKPEGFDEAVEKAKDFDSLPTEEKIEVNKVLMAYNEAMAKGMKEEHERETEVELEPLTEDALGRLVDSNDFAVDAIMAVQDALC